MFASRLSLGLFAWRFELEFVCIEKLFVYRSEYDTCFTRLLLAKIKVALLSTCNVSCMHDHHTFEARVYRLYDAITPIVLRWYA